MPYRINFFGLINFLEQAPQGRLVLLPDGSKPPADIDPTHKIDKHFARLFIQDEDVADASKWWPSVENQVLKSKKIREFRIEAASTITISGLDAAPASVSSSSSDEAEPFDESKFADKVVRLSPQNDKIQIAPEQAATIAQIPIRRGTLSSKAIVDSIVAQLEVASHAGPITITAMPSGKRLVLKPGTEIVLANISDNLGHVTSDPAVSHFRLYAQLDANRRVDLLATPTKQQVENLKIDAFKSTHRYVDHIINNGTVPDAQCSITGHP